MTRSDVHDLDFWEPSRWIGVGGAGPLRLELPGMPPIMDRSLQTGVLPLCVCGC